MKRHLLTLSVLALSCTAAFAAPSLKDNMKSLNGFYKAIKASMGDRGQNTANAANADKMIALFKTVHDQIPDAITSLPPGQQKAAVADYQRLIDAETAFATQLKAAFAAGDNVAAANIVNKMDLDKKEGHDKYNKD